MLKLFFVIYIYVCTRPVNLIAISYLRIFHELIIVLTFQRLYIRYKLLFIMFKKFRVAYFIGHIEAQVRTEVRAFGLADNALMIIQFSLVSLQLRYICPELLVEWI